MKILVTGCAGFIGFHVAKRLCARGDDVLGIDNMNDYYDVSLKEARLRQLDAFRDPRPETRDPSPESQIPSPELPVTGYRSQVTKQGCFTFKKLDVADSSAMDELFTSHKFDRVIHLAAQAGVRYSLQNPHAYIRSNVVGFMNVLESCRHQWIREQGAGSRDQGSRIREQGTGNREAVSEIKIPAPSSRFPDPSQGFPVPGSPIPVPYHLVYASSSSVYGSNTKLPFSTDDSVDHPISMYAATKKANELMAHTYSHLYGIPTTGLRFFTVYGPWGRPDMALFKFTRSILNGDPIDVYNEGKMRRDFTYIDDIVEGILRVCDHIPGLGTRNSELGDSSALTESRIPNPASRLPSPEGVTDHGPSAEVHAPYRIYNIGNHSPVELLDFIGALEAALGKKAKLNFLPMQPGDVPATYADVDDLMRDVGFKPDTPIHEGIGRFVDWYRSYYVSG